MKNTARIAGVLLVSCLLMASCSEKPTEAAAGYSITENSYVDYTFEYPDSWEVTDNTGIIMVKEPESKVSISCTTFELEDGNTAVDEYWYGTEDEPGFFEYLKSTLGGTVTVISEEETSLGIENVPARQITYSAVVAGTEYQFTQVIGIYNGAAYTLTYTAKPDTHDSYKGAMTHAVSSFSFK